MFKGDEPNPCLGGLTRFAPIYQPDGTCLPTLYAAATFECAVFESVFHDVPHLSVVKFVPLGKVTSRAVSWLQLGCDLTMASLHEPDLNRLELTRTDPRRHLCQRLPPHRPVGGSVPSHGPGRRRASMDIEAVRSKFGLHAFWRSAAATGTRDHGPHRTCSLCSPSGPDTQLRAPRRHHAHDLDLLQANRQFRSVVLHSIVMAKCIQRILS